jgi:putative acetyltransferase
VSRGATVSRPGGRDEGGPPIIHIRPYDPSDLDALIALFRDSVRRVASRDYSPEQVLAWAPDDMDRERWAARCAAKPTWVAERGGEPVGFTDLEPDGHIDMFYVHADHQGVGVASALLGRVESAARDAGIGRLFTEASKTARPFFERRGFRVIAAQTVRFNGQDFVNFRMEKWLAEERDPQQTIT